MKTTQTAVAVFVKTPGLSPFKTRLAKGIGNTQAHNFYLLSLNAIKETIQNTAITPYWAVAEKEALDHPMWQDFSTLHTGEGNLGERQHHIYETLLSRHDHVLLIGADAPQLSKTIIKQAIQALDSHEFVVGPATDGGYYLFGGRISTVKKIWKSVPWSTSETLNKLTNALPEKPFHLTSLTDVDTQDDLKYVETEMSDPLNPNQQQLLEWIESRKTSPLWNK